ncbi:MAG TPA: neutral/alkaline non-lysosomal ceramidase N-terminal domain-containing protein [Blastocatellia bacterium]|nr:neutral/alkaline non-lysosomal ceramidase N-terminal domain-containing protein [Blastocatellia bacterium]
MIRINVSFRGTLCLVAASAVMTLVLQGHAFARSSPPGEGWKAGVAKVVITPRHSMWMAGYASRTKASEGKFQDLYAKALAIEDAGGRRLVIVSTDLIGLPGSAANPIAARAQKLFGLSRASLMLTSSHTHSGPAINGCLDGMTSAAKLSAAERNAIKAYGRELQDKIVAVIGDSLKDLSAARMSFSRGEAMFGMNRREAGPNGVQFGTDKNGSVDHDVPVLRVESPSGRVKAILFGYACHNTTLPGVFYQFSGDYAGFAQEALEKSYPGVTALFLMGCGADINPQPNGTLELARRHGEALAAAVARAMPRALPVRGTLKVDFERFMLPLRTPPTRNELQRLLSSPDLHRRNHARRLLARMTQSGKLPSQLPYVAQVVQFGFDLTLVALAGEVVTDYSLRLKRELGANGLWVASYSNDVFGYIPSARVLREGGYEAHDSVVFYDLPAPFDPSVEETIIRKVHEMVRECGRRPIVAR